MAVKKRAMPVNGSPTRPVDGSEGCGTHAVPHRKLDAFFGKHRLLAALLGQQRRAVRGRPAPVSAGRPSEAERRMAPPGPQRSIDLAKYLARAKARGKGSVGAMYEEAACGAVGVGVQLDAMRAAPSAWVSCGA